MQSTAEQPTPTTKAAHGCAVKRRQRAPWTPLHKRGTRETADRRTKGRRRDKEKASEQIHRDARDGPMVSASVVQALCRSLGSGYQHSAGGVRRF